MLEIMTLDLELDGIISSSLQFFFFNDIITCLPHKGRFLCLEGSRFPRLGTWPTLPLPCQALLRYPWPQRLLWTTLY